MQIEDKDINNNTSKDIGSHNMNLTNLDSVDIFRKDDVKLNSFRTLTEDFSADQLKFVNYVEAIKHILNSNDVVHMEQIQPLLHRQFQQRICTIAKEEIHEILAVICNFLNRFETGENNQKYSSNLIRDLLSWASIKRHDSREMYLYINQTVQMLEELIEKREKPMLTIVRPTGSKVSFYNNGLMVDSTPIGFKIHGLVGCESDFRTHDIRNILTAEYRIFDNPVKVRDSFYTKFAEDLCNSDYSDFFSLVFNIQLIRTLYGNRVLLQQLFKTNTTKMCYGIEDSTYKNHLFFIYNCIKILEKMYQQEQEGNKVFSDLRTFLFELKHNVIIYFYEIVKMYI